MKKSITLTGYLRSHYTILASLCHFTCTLSWGHASETLASPVGEYRVPMPAGHTAWVYGLVAEDQWTGTAEWAVSNNTLVPGQVVTEITVVGETVEVTVLSDGPHCAEVLDGPLTGLVLDVFGSTAEKLIVHGNWAMMEPGTRLAVRAHATLGTMFPMPDCGLVAGSDLVMVACPDGTGEFAERWFVHNGAYWEDVGSAEPADNIVVYPGQGLLFSLGEQTGGGAREIVFGRGPVCHVKSTPTLVPVYASWNAAQLAGPVWPVEVEESGGVRTSGITELGLEQTLEPWTDVACVIAWNGSLDTTAVFYSDGTQLVDAVTMESGSALANVRHVNGAALIFSVMTPKYWLAEGVQ